MNYAAARQALIESEIGSMLPGEMLAELFWGAQAKAFAAGDIVFRKGEPTEARFFLLVSGELSLLDETARKELMRYGKGTLLGEVGLFNPNETRTATIMAAEKCEVMEWDFAALKVDLRQTLGPVLEKIAFQRISNYTP